MGMPPILITDGSGALSWTDTADTDDLSKVQLTSTLPMPERDRRH